MPFYFSSKKKEKQTLQVDLSYYITRQKLGISLKKYLFSF